MCNHTNYLVSIQGILYYDYQSYGIHSEALSKIFRPESIQKSSITKFIFISAPTLQTTQTTVKIGSYNYNSVYLFHSLPVIIIFAWKRLLRNNEAFVLCILLSLYFLLCEECLHSIDLCGLLQVNTIVQDTTNQVY